jgi:heat-inducible transcriptional repressor
MIGEGFSFAREEMTNRNQQVLFEIVEAFISTGEPVASRWIARRRADGLSAASVRNVMADLDEEGFLTQPHTSAGRVPTEKAFRSYVHSIATRKHLAPDIENLRADFSRLDTVEQRIEFSSRTLTTKTSGMGIAAAIPTLRPTLERIELIALPDQRVLMVVVTRGQEVSNRVVKLDEMVTAGELDSIRNYVNRNFSGWRLEDIRRELSSRLEHTASAYDEVLRKLTLLHSKGLLEIGLEPEVSTDGASNLVILDLHLTKQKMRELFRTLEEKKRILQLLDRFLEQPPGELSVQVGLSEIHPAMRELSLIGLPVTLPNGMSAVVAVLGPMRMNYGRVMATVQQVGQAFQSA